MKAVGDTIDAAVHGVHAIILLIDNVTPVLVTRGHFSTMRNNCGTMDTGDERRYDFRVFG